MKKEEYLSNDEVAGFLDYFKECIYGNIQIDHRYITKKEKLTFHASTLEDAFMAYNWMNHNYVETQNTIGDLRTRLRDAVINNRADEHSALIWSLKALVWGEVYKGSTGWLVDAAEHGRLVEYLRKAKEALDADNTKYLEGFKNQSPLRSDSGTTKIFSFLSDRSVIYDDRTAAALGMLVCRYLALEPDKYNKVPDLLNFLRGDSKERNAGEGSLIFRRKSGLRGDMRGFAHAESNLFSNWLIYEAVEDPRFEWNIPTASKQNILLADKLRAVEAALFMVGYKVR